jgi:integrating conjugative element protein (TIGR03761 family)
MSQGIGNDVGLDAEDSSGSFEGPALRLPGKVRERLTSPDDGAGVPKPALLVHVEADLMTLHTREAYWMFSGRSWSRERRRILGGQRAAAVLNELRHISVGGNPYADWFLVLFEQQMDQLRADLARVVQGYEAQIEALKSKGLTLRVLGSKQPLQIEVAFGSAYGYAIAEAMVEYDRFVRILKTLILKNRISAEAGRHALRAAGRPLRRLFVRVLLWERALQASPWRDIHRCDYLDFSDEAARHRVSGAIERFGPLPDDVLSKKILPRHFTRRSGGPGDDVLNLRSGISSEADQTPEAGLV